MSLIISFILHILSSRYQTINLSMYMSGQALAFGFELPNQDWVVFVYKQIGKSLFWAMAFVGCLTKGILAWREYVTSHLAFGQRVKYIVGNLAKHYISEVAKAAEQCHQMQPSLNKAFVRFKLT